MNFPSSFNLCIFTNAPLLPSLGHKHRHKRHKLKRGPVVRVTNVSNAAPVVSGGMFNDVESLSAGVASGALLGSASGNSSARPSNDSSGDSGPHKRTKRFLSYPRFVEVMLVADSKMVEHHGSNLQHYILTLMSIVSYTSASWLVEAVGWEMEVCLCICTIMARKYMWCTKCMYLFC